MPWGAARAAPASLGVWGREMPIPRIPCPYQEIKIRFRKREGPWACRPLRRRGFPFGFVVGWLRQFFGLVNGRREGPEITTVS